MLPRLEGKHHQVARKMLLDVVDILDRAGIVYHLEGGTLLGIVRDGDLLPWDHDIDISIPAGEVTKFLTCIWPIRRKLWRVSTRRFDRGGAAWQGGDYRLFKVKDRHLFFFAGPMCLDVFVKWENDGFAYWQAREKIMRVDAKHYRSFEEIEWQGKKLKIPCDYEAYLEAKYGDWRTPVQEWDCAKDERTVIGDV